MSINSALPSNSVIQSMINAIDKPAIFITPDYVIQAVNQAYQDTYSSKVRLGHSKCHQISHQSALPCEQHGEDCPLLQCKISHRASSVVHVHSTPKGNSYCAILMKPIVDDQGMTIGFLEILDNISYASSVSQRGKMIGKSASFKTLLNQINRAAQSNIAVLLQGETGTGKELVAQALHSASTRNDKPFVVIECTGLSESLFESELFGHEKGAFTGASSRKKGLIEMAHGGTLFFDEIGDVPLNMQVKLLRLLETQRFRAVGGLQQKSSDFRLVCASHKNLLDMVEKGAFRQDLYYRIAGFPIYLPALRDRVEDIPELIQHFVKHSDYRHKQFSAQALAALCAYSFPGNIRELRSIIEHAALLANDDTIHSSDLPSVIQPLVNNTVSTLDTVDLAQLEKQHLAQLAQTFKGAPNELAQQLGVSTRTLYRKLQRHGLNLS
jgi:DNA-binding NtrC family response regulator